jgi:excinuclease ABC subunit C
LKDFSHLKTAISLLPNQPGVYKYRDESNTIIYVGKAKNLKKRVSSYFNKEHDNRKTNVLVSKIREIEYTVVDSEYDALLLENLLIKELQPRYNINLKDDKSYPYIKITKEAFPKVSVVRNPVRDGSEYIGPYANIKMMQTVLELALKIYPIRNCNLALNEKSIADGKFNVCLEYQIGNCKGPCKGFQSKLEYQQSIDQIKNILKGQLSIVKKQIKSRMEESVKLLAFEEAHQYKTQLDWLENYQSKSTIVSHTINNVDVFAIASNDYSAWINYLRVKDGMIIQSQNIEIKRKNNETDHDLLLSAIAQFKNTNPTENEEFIVPFKLNLETTLYRYYSIGWGQKEIIGFKF